MYKMKCILTGRNCLPFFAGNFALVVEASSFSRRTAKTSAGTSFPVVSSTSWFSISSAFPWELNENEKYARGSKFVTKWIHGNWWRLFFNVSMLSHNSNTCLIKITKSKNGHLNLKYNLKSCLCPVNINAISQSLFELYHQRTFETRYTLIG